MKTKRESIDRQERISKKAVVGVGLLLFAVIAVIAAFICQYKLENAVQSILTRQRDLQQAVLDKAMDSIRVWRAELANQAKFISSSDMFRLFITDAKNLSPEEADELARPDALHSPHETVRIMAEQRAYLQDLLSNFVQRRAWTEARITTPEGSDLVARDFALPLNREQGLLIQKAVENGASSFGPLRQGENGLVMDMAEPLFEVQGTGEPRCVAALLLSVPMDRPLVSFLSNPIQQKDVVANRLVEDNLGEYHVVYLHGSHPILQLLNFKLPSGSVPFEERRGLTSPDETYSLGAELALLHWQIVVETPAAIINERIESQRWQIYGLGVGSSIALALLGSFLWERSTSRKRKERVAHLEKLNATISQQKLLLDGINASLDVGLLLVDDNGIIQVANKAFGEKILQTDKEPSQSVLAAILPTEPALKLGAAMANVCRENKDDNIEIILPDKDGKERLFRVSLFPYQAEEGETSSSGHGCVGVFKDITKFRQRAEVTQKRQKALLVAMDRALESVDPNLVGDSGKMARLGALLGKELNMTPEELETIQMAALLSQIGKLFVPKELLRKTGRLTPEEKQEVARAPQHADRILKDLNFDLPVRETIRELNEKTDGSGPFGIKGDGISRCGKVLSLANALVGMTNYRAWKTSRPDTPAEAVEKLGKSQDKYDAETIRALQRLDIRDIIHALSEEDGLTKKGAAA